MSIWKIPVTWEMCGFVEIEAPTLKEAYEYVKEDPDNMPLPEEKEYVEDSFHPSHGEEELEVIRDCYNKGKKNSKDLNLDEVFDILEDFKVFEPEEQDGQWYVDVEFYSPAGEDVIETIWFDNTVEGFIRAFRKNAEDFDADAHAEMWIDARGTRGVPNSIRELIDDAEAIKKQLFDGVKMLEELMIAAIGGR